MTNMIQSDGHWTNKTHSMSLTTLYAINYKLHYFTCTMWIQYTYFSHEDKLKFHVYFADRIFNVNEKSVYSNSWNVTFIYTNIGYSMGS